MFKISSIHPREILDSRGLPTVEVDIILDGGYTGRASIPSGMSTGQKEALELRDIHDTRFHGKGVLQSVKNIKSQISEMLLNQTFTDPRQLDSILLSLDDTSNKNKVGANTILSVSLAFAQAAAKQLNLPLFKALQNWYFTEKLCSNALPHSCVLPMFNLINGGQHADNGLDIQEFMIVPKPELNLSERVRAASEIYMTLKQLLKRQKLATNVGDEGGFAPNLFKSRTALDLLSEAIAASGYEGQVDIALDAAASSFYDDNTKHYTLYGEKIVLDSSKLIKYYSALVDDYPIISIEDPLAENDYDGWKNMTEQLKGRVKLVGDDIFVTQEKELLYGIENDIANAILIKPNQVGSLSETVDTIKLAHKNCYHTIISHRSGDTEDNFISHLALATGSWLKSGAPCRGERTSKYNELLRSCD